ncbi:hypothetical protein DVK05_01515 [Halorubrum sp. Atlit-8R]|uniref:hypothetical protein n=1 Tax=unclassified Halorubrum TaxID=2642239 RepID=UPI000EF1F1A4|nr:MULTISPECIES: hypothetical protein [unclassified Halorubrum]RLM71359.1 hypothetical protein DVK08_04245 [Halorubrum sp. Atlit-9R]RLM82488.1 hypothetical protein DVK05_01515 [Halorubrum sp. Atlit-8R]
MTAPATDERDRTGDAKRRADRDFRRELLASARAIDVFALLAVPGALIAVFALPEATRRSLVFAYTDPTLRSAFTAHYVHLSADHLLGNLAGYGLLAGVGYALAALSGRRRLFFTAFATYLGAFPLALSALNLAVPRNAIGFGFSGVNMALAGLLPILWYCYARERFFPAASVAALPAVFFGLVGWIALLALPVSTEGIGLGGLAIGVASGLLAVLYAASSEVRFPPPVREHVRTVASRPGHGDLLAVAAVVAVGYPVVGFPSDPSGGGSVVNLYVHLLGFCLGFIGPFALLAGGAFDG